MRTCLTCGANVADNTISLCPTCGAHLPPVILTGPAAAAPAAAAAAAPAAAAAAAPAHVVTTPAPITGLWFPILMIVIGIAALIFAIMTLPIFMGGWSMIPIIGAAGMIAGGLFGIGKALSGRFNRTSNVLSWCGLGMFLIPILIVALISGFKILNERLVTAAATAATDSAFVPEATPVPTAAPAAATAATTSTDSSPVESVTTSTTAPASNTTPASIDAFKPKVAVGETISANKEFQVKAGDVVSGDVYYCTADDVAVPIMDDDSTTALVVYFTQGARLRTGDNWSVYLVHQPTEEEIANIVTEKQKENFERVDLISFPQTQKQSTK